MSRWVRGTRKPVTSELDVRDGFEVDGVLPPITGSLIRMSVNPIGSVGPDHQWFAGPGMVHAIELDAGRPSRYVNRWVRTPSVSRALGEPSVLVPRHDNEDELANTTVAMVGSRLLSMTETFTPIELNADLQTLRRVDFGGVATHFTAHPHTDPMTGEVFAVGYEVNDDASCSVIRIGPDGSTSSHRVDLLGSRSIHDFAMTTNYLVVWDLPLHVSKPDSALFEYRWRQDQRARVGLIPRQSLSDQQSLGAVSVAVPRWFEIDPCWVFHPLNAWETDGRVLVDVCQFDRVFDTDRTGPGDPYPPQFWRWELNLTTGKANQTLLDDRIQEFPRVDARQWGQRHEVGFTIELFNRGGSASVIAHHVDRGAVDVWSSPAGTVLSEAIFVSDDDSAVKAPKGNEGWVLVIESTRHHSSLVVLDATQLHRGPLGRVRLPQRIPDGFHGDWIGQ
jgi:carotenoid cleavage dioxygenase-like enzyme